MHNEAMEFLGTSQARQVNPPSAAHVPGTPAIQRVRLMLFVALLVVFPAAAKSQVQIAPPAGGGHPYASNANDPMLPMMDGTGALDARLLGMLNVARQRALVSNAEKLVTLARELNDEVAATKTATLTQSELHKIAKIEKLAHSVKNEMSYTVTGNPAVEETRTIILP